MDLLQAVNTQRSLLPSFEGFRDSFWVWVVGILLTALGTFAAKSIRTHVQPWFVSRRLRKDESFVKLVIDAKYVPHRAAYYQERASDARTYMLVCTVCAVALFLTDVTIRWSAYILSNQLEGKPAYTLFNEYVEIRLVIAGIFNAMLWCTALVFFYIKTRYQNILFACTFADIDQSERTVRYKGITYTDTTPTDSTG